METIKVKSEIKAPISKVWQYWTQPEHIEKWNQANEDWLTSKAENDLKKGGKFQYRMEAKDGSTGFDFEGTYEKVKEEEALEYKLADGRKVSVNFSEKEDRTIVEETFEAETENPPEMQKQGWQAILDNFKKYTEEK